MMVHLTSRIPAEASVLDKIKNFEPSVLAGLFGALIAMYYTKPLGWGKSMIAGLMGFSMAVFVSPMIAEMFFDSVKAEAAISFLTGMFGISVAGIVFQILELLKRSPTNTIGQFFRIVVSVLLASRHGVFSEPLKEDVKKYGRRKDDKPEDFLL